MDGGHPYYPEPSSSTSPSPAAGVATAHPPPDQDADPRRKHRCSHCAKAFTTSGHLSRHIKIHTGERSHKCPFPGCTTTCSRQDNLQQHYRIHLSPVAAKRNSGRTARTASSREHSADPTEQAARRRKRSRREPAVVPLEASLPLSAPAPPPSPPLTPPPLERASIDVLMGLRPPRVLPSQTPPVPIYNAQHIATPPDAPGPSAYAQPPPPPPPQQHQHTPAPTQDAIGYSQGYYQPPPADPRYEYRAYAQTPPAAYPQYAAYDRHAPRAPSPPIQRAYAHSASPAPLPPAHDPYGASRYPSPSSTGEQPGNEYPRAPDAPASRYASPIAYDTHPAYRAAPPHADAYRAPSQPQYAPAPAQPAYYPPPHTDYRGMPAPAPESHPAPEPARRSTLPGLASLLPPEAPPAPAYAHPVYAPAPAPLPPAPAAHYAHAPPPAIQAPLTSYLSAPQHPQPHAHAPQYTPTRGGSPAIVLPPLQGPGAPARIALPPIQARAWP